MNLFYGTAVAYCGFGVLIQGVSGSGKSDLALRLIDDGADLIADDQVIIKASEKGLHLSPPDSIAGLIEIRGFGVVKLEPVYEIPLYLLVKVNPTKQQKRMPKMKKKLIRNISVPIININPFESSALAKIKIVLRYLDKNIELI
ncbi:MAG: HPr kinase/phosphatase C-terminal domain-containing protein [Pseudomonadota bacterium]|nr:HPr kinase/phosphatase C-terminal domain-containing protein [Pseudomonadota bacterium]